MPRRYNEVEARSFAELEPGDEEVIIRRVESVLRRGDEVVVTWSDGAVVRGPLDTVIEVRKRRAASG